MALTINTNAMSLEAQRNLTTSQSSLATSLQRLSSGLRINSAKDDAAGLAIASRMGTQISGLTVAQQNANDAISLAQTSEGALQEVTNNLQRIRELAVQAANASNSASDRAALNDEVQQRLAVLDQIASTTSYNGQHVLDGSFGAATFQVGANVGDTVSLNLSTSMRTADIGKVADWVGNSAYDASMAVGQQGAGVDSTTALTSGALTIAIGNGDAVSVKGAVAGNSEGQDAASAYAVAQAINGSSIDGLTATANTTAVVAWTDVAAASGYSLSVNGTSVFSASTDAITGDQAAAAINANSNTTGVTATFDGSTGNMTLTAADGRNVTLEQTNSGSTGLTAPAAETVPAAGTTAATPGNNTVNAGQTIAEDGTAVTFTGSVHLTAADTITVGGTGAAAAGFTAGTLALGTNGVGTASVDTVAGANTTISMADAALAQVNSLRSSLGAIESSFESLVSSMSVTSENLSTAQGRIQDADFAAETANLSRAQILQQAGTAILAQANSIPQNVLKLLQ
ncbi:MAG TPA: flagellin [Steroidobacteraceae bacterium]|nr:flagellin [Steroidobacteraceae bacterium]